MSNFEIRTSRLVLRQLTTADAGRIAEDEGCAAVALHARTAEIFEASLDEIEQVRAVHPQLMKHVGPPCSVRSGLVRPRCTEGSHFCGVPVWRSFPDIQRRI